MKKTLLSALCVGAAFCMSAQTVVFEEDFEWLEPWSSIKPAGQTVETDNPDATAQQLGTNKVNEVSTYEALTAKGYEFPVCCATTKSPREPKAQIYLQKNYLKFGLTGYYSGITLPAFENVPEGAETTISFDYSSQRQGSGKWDKTALVVIVKNGDKEEQFPATMHDYADSEVYAWHPISVKLGTSVTKDSRITIRNVDEQWPDEKASTYRFFLDNIKVTATEAAPVNPVAEVLWADDFEWFAPWSIKGNDQGDDKGPAGDTVGCNMNTEVGSTNAPQIGMPHDDEGTLFTHALHSKGFRYMIAHGDNKSDAPATQSIYIQTNYLKFGKTGYQTGIAFPPMTTDAENVTVEFDWCPMRQGSGKIDPVNLIVFVGTQTAEDELLNTTFDKTGSFEVPTHGWANDHALEWIHATVVLEGLQVKAGQQIGITQKEAGSTTANRWFLDNVKITGKASTTAVEEVAVDANAPVEYYNLQGVRVANPESGLYIRRQGNKVTKVLVK